MLFTTGHYTERHSTLFVALLQSFKLSLDSKKQDRCESSLISLKGQGHHPAWLMCGYAAAFTEEELAQTSICNFLATIKQMKSALLLQSTVFGSLEPSYHLRIDINE